MIEAFPDEVVEMIRFLENIQFSVTELVVTQSFGSKHITLRNGEIEIRVLNDRGIWDIVVDRQPAADWFDILIIKEEIFGEISDDRLSLDEQWEFLVGHFSRIKEILLAAGSSQRLNSRREQRAIRIFGADFFLTVPNTS